MIPTIFIKETLSSKEFPPKIRGIIPMPRIIYSWFPPPPKTRTKLFQCRRYSPISFETEEIFKVVSNYWLSLCR